MDVSMSGGRVIDPLAATYLAIAQPANRELDHEFDGFGDHVKDGELAAAQADLS
jgi:hypothetical protein